MQLAPSHGWIGFFFAKEETHCLIGRAEKTYFVTLLYYSFKRGQIFYSNGRLPLISARITFMPEACTLTRYG